MTVNLAIGNPSYIPEGCAEVRSKHETAMKNEVLCKFLCHNICCVIMEQCVLGIDPVFWPEDAPAASDGPDVLRFPAG